MNKKNSEVEPTACSNDPGPPNAAARESEPHRIIEPEYLTVDQVAALFDVTSRTIRSWMRQRLIPYFKIGRTIRFRRQNVYEYLCQNCRN